MLFCFALPLAMLYRDFGSRRKGDQTAELGGKHSEQGTYKYTYHRLQPHVTPIHIRIIHVRTNKEPAKSEIEKSSAKILARPRDKNPIPKYEDRPK
jgi:hypothetical protein